MQPCMYGSRVHQVSHCHLVYASQPLVIGVRYNLQDQFIIDGDKSVNGVVYYFSKCH